MKWCIVYGVNAKYQKRSLTLAESQVECALEAEMSKRLQCDNTHAKWGMHYT